MNKQYYCINCGKEISYYSVRCKDCYKIFRKLNKKNNYCIDCNKIISFNAIRCQSCTSKLHCIGKNKEE